MNLEHYTFNVFHAADHGLVRIKKLNFYFLLKMAAIEELKKLCNRIADNYTAINLVIKFDPLEIIIVESNEIPFSLLAKFLKNNPDFANLVAEYLVIIIKAYNQYKQSIAEFTHACETFNACDHVLYDIVSFRLRQDEKYFAKVRNMIVNEFECSDI